MRHTSFRRFRTIGALLTVQLVTAIAGTPVDPVNKNHAGIAIKGYDTVAYFRDGKPAKGSSEYSHSWKGATWHFSGAANRDLFAADPEMSAPQFGGYCAWAVGHGYTANIDPDSWKIIAGKLYLNYSKDVQRKWQADSVRLITDGNRNWPNLHH